MRPTSIIMNVNITLNHGDVSNVLLAQHRWETQSKLKICTNINQPSLKQQNLISFCAN